MGKDFVDMLTVDQGAVDTANKLLCASKFIQVNGYPCQIIQLVGGSEISVKVLYELES